MDSGLVEELWRQSVAQTQAMESLASELKSKDSKPFRERFKQKSEAPKFNGDANEWDKYKHKFISFLGEMNLEQLISESE